MKISRMIHSRLAATKSSLPPCCLRVHPNDTSLILLGTYQLEKDSGRRHGSVEMWKYADGHLEQLRTYPTDGAILDLKFGVGGSTLVTAHSTGNIMVWRSAGADLELVHDKALFDPDTLITSIFFSPTHDELLVTLTSGASALVDLATFEVNELDTSHSLECWTGAFGEVGPLSNVVFTGGDDLALIAHDRRTNGPIWTAARAHDAGVVAILPASPHWNAANAHHLWTGSYDDHLRVLDLRITEQSTDLIPGLVPRVLQKENLGGGVWRLIPSPVDQRVLACCMYDGARIINGGESFLVEGYFKGDHESMCYGGDWASDGSYVATCSFYDNVVQVWEP